MVDLIPLISVVGAGVLRNVAGWLENSFEDGKIQDYEWAELGATIIRVGMIGVGTYYAFDLAPLAAGASGLIGDFILRAIKKIGKK